MELKQSIEIQAQPKTVWPFLADPSRHALWNNKVVQVDRDSIGAWNFGSRYTIQYRLGNKITKLSGEILLYDEPKSVCFQTVDGQNPKRTHTEHYALQFRNGATVVFQTINISNEGIPRGARWLVGLLMRFGKPVDTRYLENLKAHVEKQS